MKNYSAPKLLRMALVGEHIARCPHKNTTTRSTECVCWPNEVKRWDLRMKSALQIRVRSPKKTKTHLVGLKCGARQNLTTTITNDVNCLHCVKLMTAPVKAVKPPRIKKVKNNVLNFSADFSTAN